jgi:hypothetical protein
VYYWSLALCSTIQIYCSPSWFFLIPSSNYDYECECGGTKVESNNQNGGHNCQSRCQSTNIIDSKDKRTHRGCSRIEPASIIFVANHSFRWELLYKQIYNCRGPSGVILSSSIVRPAVEAAHRLPPVSVALLGVSYYSKGHLSRTWCNRRPHEPRNVVRGTMKKSISGARAVTSDPSVAGRSFSYQSYKSHGHGYDSAMFDNVRFFHRPTSTQSQDTVAFYCIA